MIFKLCTNNALQFIDDLQDKSVSLILIAPSTLNPEINANWLRKCKRILKDDGIFCSFMTPKTIREFTKQVEERFSKCNIGYWQPDDIVYPFIYTGIKYKILNYIAMPRDPAILGFPEKAHQPIELIKLLIKTLSPSGLIVDFFLGSGTTAIACKELNREFMGCDRHEPYIKIAKQRIGEQKIQCHTNI